jgi:hypothetical protein
MTFVAAVTSAPSIRARLKDGLQALRNVDRGRVSCDGRRLLGSVDIDGALRPSQPNAARWDYAVGFSPGSRGDFVAWLEVHPASSQHVSGVLDKLAWLNQWIRHEGQDLGRLRGCFCWIATGTISFGRNSPQARRIAQAGLRFPLKHAYIEQLFKQR